MSEGPKRRYREREDRTPPPDIVIPGFKEAEQYALACLFEHGSAAMEAFNGLTAKDFADPAHQAVYAVAQDLFEAGKEISYFSIFRSLKEGNQLDQIGGRDFLTSLRQHEVTLSDAVGYADTIMKIARRRRAATALREAGEIVLRTDRDIDEAFLQVNDLVSSAVADKTSGVVTLDEAAVLLYKDIEERQAHPEKYKKISSGLHQLDKLIGGLEPGRLYIVAARPGKGKTAFVLSVAHHVAKIADRSVLVFSLEMGVKEMTKRLISIEGHIDGRLIRDPEKMQPHELRQFREVADRLPKNILLSESDNPSPAEIRATIRQRRRTVPKDRPLEVVIIDYLQLMGSTTGGGGGEMSRVQELSLLTRAIKQLARAENVAVLLLSQLSRDIEKRQGSKRPQLSDLRDSGSIESDADVVMFVHREDQIGEAAAQIGPSEVQDAMIIVAKNRDGEQGDAKCGFMGKYTHFVDIVPEGSGPQLPTALEEEDEPFA